MFTIDVGGASSYGPPPAGTITLVGVGTGIAWEGSAPISNPWLSPSSLHLIDAGPGWSTKLAYFDGLIYLGNIHADY